MTRLDVSDAAWAGLVAVYSIIHLPSDDRRRAYREFARVLRPGAWILVAFHIDSATANAGDSIHLDEFLGHSVDLDGYFPSPDLSLSITDRGTSREPEPGIPSTRLEPSRHSRRSTW